MGEMGAFETDFTVPDLKSTPLKMSSIVMASQLQPAGKHDNPNDPLIRNGSEIVPSVTRVFSSGQHLYFYYEVYDPARSRNAPPKLRLARRERLITTPAAIRKTLSAC